MKKQYLRFLPPFISLLLIAIIVLFFTNFFLSWKVVIIVLSALFLCCAWWINGSTATDNQHSDLSFSKKSLKELSILLEYNDAIVSILNGEMHTIFRSPAAARITGWPDAEFSLRPVAQHCHPDDCALFSDAFTNALNRPNAPQHISFRLQHKHGHYIWLEGWITNMLENPSVRGVVTNLRDITALKKMAAEAERNRKFYQFLSEVNHMIVQAQTANQLFSEACRIAVKTGGHHYAFVALREEGKAGLIVNSHAGISDSADRSIAISLLQQHEYGAAAIMNGQSHFIQQINEQGQYSADTIREDAANDQHSSLILLPLSVKNRQEGIVGIWSVPGYSFDSEEISLLKEMAADISYSLTHLREKQLRLRMQQDLQESERRYEVLAESAPVGIFHTDETGYTTYVNPRWREISGMKEAPALGDDWLAAVHPDDRDIIHQGWENATQGNRPSSTSEYRFLKPDGSTVYVLGLAVAQTNSQGSITGYVGTIIDITERKKAEEEILRLLKEVTHEKSLSDSVINSLPGIFYLFDEQGGFIRWNADFATVTGYAPDEILEMHPLDFVSSDDRELVGEKIKQVFIRGEQKVQADLLTKTGTRIPYYFTGKMIGYKGRPCLLGVGVDFTEKIAAQQKIRETTAQLRLLAAHLQDVREEERKSIGREIHDELGQTLTAIKMDFAWINKRITDDELLKQKLTNVNVLLDRGNHSVRRILTQLRPGIFQSGGLLDAIGWLLRQFKETSSITANFDCNHDQAKLPDAISTCIFRVIQEALTNITRYAKAQRVDCTLTIDEASVSLMIKDDGIGFDPATVASHRSFGILGMKERVLSLNGMFTLHSEPGRGAVIEIRIPVAT